MLSYYDTLSFSVRRRSFLVGLCISLLMMALFAGVYFLLERQFAIFSNFKKLLQPTSIASFSESIRRVAATLQDGYFRSVVSQQLLILLLSFLFFNLVFFSWQTISAKKELFQQTSHSSVSFYIVALIEMLALLLPFFACTYLLLSKLLPWCVNYLCDDLLLIKTQPFKFPYPIKEAVAYGIGVFVWTVYTISLFICHFSFVSLFDMKTFFQHITVALEMILHIVTSVVVLGAIFVGIGYCCWTMDPIYVCFFWLLVYFVCTITTKCRWVFILFFLIIIGGGFGLNTLWGYGSFRSQMITYLQSTLIYFSFFFLISCFFSALAYSYASTAYVFRFNKTPSKDVKEQAPEKLRRMDQLYSTYLKEHKNDVQDNFFHHMEE